MRFSYKIEYVPGKQLCTADALSRAPLPKFNYEEQTRWEEVSGYVNLIMKSFPATEKRLTEIKGEQDKDKTLSQAKEYCKTGWPAQAKKDDKEFAQFSECCGILHKTSSPLHPESKGEAERAARTIKNLLRKASDPYIALLNYRATPIQQGRNPAELLMGRQLRTKLPVHNDCYKPNWSYLKNLNKMGKQMKHSQKSNYDIRLRAKPLTQLHPGQTVWIKTPKHQEAVITRQVEQPSHISYIIETQWGQMRGNRFQLGRRDETSPSDGSTRCIHTA
ncbi:Pol polyprotein [Elysia marginata]|uniref:Pol polyprotein n=1 Tax=Elysia marginata TaxID=1093978 RepID=A0AAV4IAS7_9GAST|nr:Pol polyprotein [Elysia marginata]